MGVDVEALAVHVLLQDAGVIALVGNRVFGALPAPANTLAYPLVRVWRIGGPTDSVGYLDAALVQFEGWHGGKSPRADTAWRTADAAMAALLNKTGVYPQGVLLGCRPSVGMHRVDDPVTGYPRYMFDFTVFARPVAA